MTEKELGHKLKTMYDNAPNGEKVTMIHLFGIQCADEIKRSKYSIKGIIKASKINVSYATEVSKGVNLANYVQLKSEK